MKEGKAYWFDRIARCAALLLLLGMFSCSSSKYVPKGEYLLNRVEVKVDNPEINREELDSYLRQKENLRILGFLKFHLWVYNLSSPKKTDDWLKRIGEQPQVYSADLMARSADQLQQYLWNKGYYGATVKSEVHKNEDKRKVDLLFRITTGEPYRISNLSFLIADSLLREQFHNEYPHKILREGNRFDLDLLNRERENITRFFQNKGYYNFSKSMIYFEADTLRRGNAVDLSLVVDLPEESQQDSVRIYKRYRINNYHYTVLPGSAALSRGQAHLGDTVRQDKYTFIFRDYYKYNPRLFTRLNKMAESDWYRLENVEKTFDALNRLRQFRFINIYFQEMADSAGTGLLNCRVDMAPLSKQSSSFDVEGTNTSGNFGMAGNLNYVHRNLFRGAEVLNVRLKGAMERQQAVVSNESRDFNTRETGLEATLTVPKLFGPASLFRSFGDFLPKTVTTLGYNYQQRPDYTRVISTFRLGYEWMTSRFSRHMWNVVDFNMVDLSRFDPGFINSIKDLYIKSSFTDHLILATNYSYVYNTQVLNTRSNYTYLKVTAESSGNLLNLLSGITGAEKTVVPDTSGLRPQAFYRFLDTRYAQYVKADLEFRKGYVIDRYNSVVGRAFLGIGLPYGNFDVLPFEKKYFTGGANGIRAWQVRSLGPGTYRASVGDYPNQSSDIKIEANLEYRFRLIKYLEGAFFLDAGNIWAINQKDNRPGAQFYWNRFYRELALGTGTGFRFDFSYFIFRLDLGMKLRDPAQSEGNGWIIGTRKITGNDFNFSFAIGYPF